MKEFFPSINEEGDVIVENEREAGLFDDMSPEEEQIAMERIGGALLQDRYKEYSDENRNIFTDIENGIFSRTSEITQLHPRIAQYISKKTRLISLPNLVILYEDAALFLGKHEGGLYLSGLRTLEYGVARQLAKHKGFIDLNSLEILSDPDAESFAKHKGELKLTGLKSVSDEGLKKLAQHEDRVYLPEAFQKKWEEYRKEVYPVRKVV